MGHFTARVITEDTQQLVFLVTGKRKAWPVWCYALVPASRRAAFSQALSQGEIDVAQFGHLLFSGAGKAPPEEIQQIIATHYT